MTDFPRLIEFAFPLAPLHRKIEMIDTEITQVADIIERVKTWPATMRMTLARRILETVDAPFVPEPDRRQRGPTTAEVAAMFKIDEPAPSDEECQQILDVELSEKYMP